MTTTEVTEPQVAKAPAAAAHGSQTGRKRTLGEHINRILSNSVVNIVQIGRASCRERV